MTSLIDLRRLHVLRTVAHYGTVTAAAGALHLTTSAVSHQVRQLGRELDVALLEPQGRGVRLTAAARHLLRHAEVIEAHWEQAEAELHGLRDQPVGLLRTCGFPVAITALLAPMAASLEARHPQLTVQVREVAERASFDLLFNDEVDLAIVEAAPGNPPFDDAGFDQRVLVEDAFDLLVADGHRWAAGDGIPLVEAAHERWIVPADECTSRTQALAACNAAGFTPRVTQHALEWSAIAGLVASGLGVALVPRMAGLPADLAVTRVPVVGEPQPSRILLTCTRSGSRGRPTISAAVTELRRLVDDGGLSDAAARRSAGRS